jgi:hypothetical protein
MFICRFYVHEQTVKNAVNVALSCYRFWRLEAHALTYEPPGFPPRTVVAEAGDRHGDAGYLSTSRMIVEAALCLALQVAPCSTIYHSEGYCAIHLAVVILLFYPVS